MPKCNRCGLCCHYIDDKGILKKCAMLQYIGLKSFCRIYNHRLGHVIFKKKGFKTIHCVMVEDTKTNFEGCPYNKPGQKESQITFKKSGKIRNPTFLVGKEMPPNRESLQAPEKEAIERINTSSI